MPRKESAEDYLETILILSVRNGSVRSIDIVNEMGFSKPSVSVAMKNLRGRELIHMDDAGLITFTPEGKILAERVYERHTVLMSALRLMGVSEETAREDACRVEHDISDETFDRLKEFLQSRTKSTLDHFNTEQSDLA